ncbi:hypothetical protein Pcinc_006188 [Petrolisthes cinctipes]|uniref:Uncharacterized protein n=1 Tax=Petrolisthes cinctipes TaxID=88211 RepID=A0AAE1GDE4_PETCI|nr:hypothetical protein Pcinc_006188 [Petrolisthes cinctipes]
MTLASNFPFLASTAQVVSMLQGRGVKEERWILTKYAAGWGSPVLLPASSALLAGGNMEGSAGWKGAGEGVCRVVERAGDGWGPRS